MEKQPENNKENFWIKYTQANQTNFGPHEAKNNTTIGSFFKNLEKHGKIHPKIIDLGSGDLPTLYELPFGKYKIYAIDLISDEEKHPGNFIGKYIKEDIDPENKSSYEIRRIIARIKNKAEIKEGEPLTIVLSYILNYVDARTLIKKLFEILPIKSNIIILNKEHVGVEEMMKKNRLTNQNLVDYIKSSGFNVTSSPYIAFETSVSQVYKGETQGKTVLLFAEKNSPH